MTDPQTYEQQKRAIQAQNLRRALFTLPFAAVGFLAAFLMLRAFHAHLDEELYRPACRTTCVPLGGVRGPHRLGGKSARGRVFCPCVQGDKAVQADLSRGSALDLALHWGLAETLSLGVFVFASGIGMLVANRWGTKVGDV